MVSLARVPAWPGWRLHLLHDAAAGRVLVSLQLRNRTVWSSDAVAGQA